MVVDDAHGVGVFGRTGAGLAASLGLEREIDVHIGTLSKALGAYGAYVGGSWQLIDYLLNPARSFVYSTGLPPAIAAAADAAIGLIEAEPARIAQLHANARQLREGLARAGFTIGSSDSPILPVMVGEAQPALNLAESPFARGLYVIAIRPPTVPAGSARLRVTPIATHTPEQLAGAVAAFADAGRAMGILH